MTLSEIFVEAIKIGSALMLVVIFFITAAISTSAMPYAAKGTYPDTWLEWHILATEDVFGITIDRGQFHEPQRIHSR